MAQQRVQDYFLRPDYDCTKVKPVLVSRKVWRAENETGKRDLPD